MRLERGEEEEEALAGLLNLWAYWPIIVILGRAFGSLNVAMVHPLP